MIRLAPVLFIMAAAFGADWPQFRGPNASGVADGTNPPVEFDPDDSCKGWDRVRTFLAPKGKN